MQGKRGRILAGCATHNWYGPSQSGCKPQGKYHRGTVTTRHRQENWPRLWHNLSWRLSWHFMTTSDVIRHTERASQIDFYFCACLTLLEVFVPFGCTTTAVPFVSIERTHANTGGREHWEAFSLFRGCVLMDGHLTYPGGPSFVASAVPISACMLLGVTQALYLWFTWMMDLTVMSSRSDRTTRLTIKTTE